MRKSAGKYNSTFYSTPLKFIENTPTELVLSKPPMLALLTNQGASANPTWNVGAAGYSANQELIDVISCQKVTTDSTGAVKLNAQQGAPMVFLP